MKNLPVVLGVLAIATAFPAWMPARAKTAADQAKVETVFGKAVKPDVIADLRVAEWDETTSTPKVLEVKRSGNDWVIPSHFDFPADANTRVSKAAATFLGLPRGLLRSEDPKRFEELGVIDPLDQAAQQKSGRGKRVTMTDITGQVVSDLIIGKRVEQGEGVYFVREAGANQVYSAKVDPDISTKFIDYVEADPLKIKREDVRAITVADYSVDEAQGRVDMRSETPLMRTGDSETWTTSGAVPPDKRVAQGTAGGILTALTSMHLAGVRPFEMPWLQSRGFFFAPPGAVDKTSPVVSMQGKQYAVVGNEGRLDVTTKDGLRYSLMFGEVALDDEADTAADKVKPGEKKADEPKKDDAKKDDKPGAPGHNRYMVVFVQYDAALDQEANKPEPEKKDDQSGAPKKDAKKKSGKERAAKAQERFLKYFYVISDDSFKQLRPALDKLFEAKPPEAMAGNTGKTLSQWLADNAKRPEIKTTASGLQYEVLSEGAAGGKKPAATDQVQVRYRGTLVDGTEFDASKDAPAQFAVTGVIKGWTEALQLMKEGDKLKLYIKPELGYGEAGSPPKIPANSILIFEVELVKVIGEGQPQAAAPAPASAPAPEAAAPAPAAPAAPKAAEPPPAK